MVFILFLLIQESSPFFVTVGPGMGRPSLLSDLALSGKLRAQCHVVSEES